MRSACDTSEKILRTSGRAVSVRVLRAPRQAAAKIAKLKESISALEAELAKIAEEQKLVAAGSRSLRAAVRRRNKVESRNAVI